MFRGLEPPARNLLIYIYISFASKVMKQSPRCCLLGGFAALIPQLNRPVSLGCYIQVVENPSKSYNANRWYNDTSSRFTQKSVFFSITHLWELPSPPPRFKVPRMGCGGAAQQRSPTTGASKSDTWIHVWGTKWLDPAFWVNSSIWVCLKMGYTSNYSHLVGIMIINHWV